MSKISSFYNDNANIIASCSEVRPEGSRRHFIDHFLNTSGKMSIAALNAVVLVAETGKKMANVKNVFDAPKSSVSASKPKAEAGVGISL